MATKTAPKKAPRARKPKKQIGLLVNVVLDRSSSMNWLTADTIEAYNKFIDDQKTGDPTWVSLTLFDTTFEHVYVAKPIEEVPKLDQEVYRAHGNTALYDAIAHAIAQTGSSDLLENTPEGVDQVKVLTVVITDGEENSSQEFNRPALFKLIEQKQTEGWDFVYLGANHDAYRAAASISIPAGYTSGYTSSSAGTSYSMHATSNAVDTYRGTVTASGGASPAMFFAGTDAAQLKDDKPKPKKVKKSKRYTSKGVDQL